MFDHRGKRFEHQIGPYARTTLYEVQDTVIDRSRAACQSRVAADLTGIILGARPGLARLDPNWTPSRRPAIEPSERSVDPETSHVALLVALRACRQRD